MKKNKLLILTSLLTFFATLNAVDPSTDKAPSNETPMDIKTGDPAVDKNLTLSAIATKAWLDLVDKMKYGESWDSGSQLMKSTVKRDEWIKILTKTRKPLGEVKSRSVLDQRTAKNPKNMPQGDYMVMFYNTSFEKKALAYELITLYLEPSGQWKVITYNVN